ncbi:hypothetical protein GCM10010873_01420 [Cypionkella aquatica]|uniref:Uncharacterized protein n=1 Tax=Cypionkella aquatica TaxID=1756042 RepID=A0AA37TNQ7_9RHOB|nr:hypothetical protein [Cypionkella aquatica]GLS85169.1 hypothetical protein GCM10010873_01420 [Cypionkella aquatica]
MTRLGGSVLALALEPTHSAGDLMDGAAEWRKWLDWRTEVLARLAASFDLPPSPFRPHLTLGYFANPYLVAEDDADLAELSDQITNALSGIVLTWQAVGLYRFTSMAKITRVARQKP